MVTKECKVDGRSNKNKRRASRVRLDDLEEER